MKKLFITGTHGSGKTTLIQFLHILHPSIPIFPEAAVCLNNCKNISLVLDKNVEANRQQRYNNSNNNKTSPCDEILKSQREIFDLTFLQGCSTQLGIHDRTIIDVYVYTKYFSKQYPHPEWDALLTYQKRKILAYLDKSDDIYLLCQPKDFVSSYQKAIHDILETTYQDEFKRHVFFVPWTDIYKRCEIVEKYAHDFFMQDEMYRAKAISTVIEPIEPSGKSFNL